ncbi:MAG: T9SS type A sorting domain-containing protein [bacterium]
MKLKNLFIVLIIIFFFLNQENLFNNELIYDCYTPFGVNPIMDGGGNKIEVNDGIWTNEFYNAVVRNETYLKSLFKFNSDLFSEINCNFLGDRSVFSIIKFPIDNVSKFFAGTENGLFYYNNNNSEWGTNYNSSDDNLKKNKINCIKKISNNNLIAIMGTNIFQSTDNGLNWNKTNTYINFNIKSFEFRDNGNIITYLIGKSDGIYFSTDNCISWDEVTPRKYEVNFIFKDDNNNIYIGQNFSVYKVVFNESNIPTSFEKIGNDLSSIVTSIYTDNSDFYCGTSNNLYKLNTNSWLPVDDIFSGKTINDIIKFDSKLFIATNDALCMKSSSWSLHYQGRNILDLFIEKDSQGSDISLLIGTYELKNPDFSSTIAIKTLGELGPSSFYNNRYDPNYNLPLYSYCPRFDCNGFAWHIMEGGRYIHYSFGNYYVPIDKNLGYTSNITNYREIKPTDNDFDDYWAKVTYHTENDPTTTLNHSAIRDRNPNRQVTGKKVVISKWNQGGAIYSHFLEQCDYYSGDNKVFYWTDIWDLDKLTTDPFENKSVYQISGKIIYSKNIPVGNPITFIIGKKPKSMIHLKSDPLGLNDFKAINGAEFKALVRGNHHYYSNVLIEEPQGFNHEVTVNDYINDQKENDLKLFPNPTSDILNIKISGNIDKSDFIIEIFSYNGEKIFSDIISENNFSINVNNWVTGLYLVKATVIQSDYKEDDSFSLQTDTKKILIMK